MLVVRRFANTSDISIQTSTFEPSPSTSSVEPIPISSDASSELPPSRIATSANRPQDLSKVQKDNQNGIDINPEGRAAKDGNTEFTKNQVESLSARSSSVLATKATTQGDFASEPALTTRSPATTAAASSQTTLAASTDTDDSNSVPRLPSPSNNVPNDSSSDRHSRSQDSLPIAGNSLPSVDAMGAFQRARSSIIGSEAPESPSVTQAISTPQLATSSVTALPKAPSSQGDNTSAPQTSQGSSIPDNAAESTESSDSAEATATPAVAASSVSESTSIVGQVPSFFLGTLEPSPVSSEMKSASSTAKAPQYAFPDEGLGYSQMAQGYNKIFKNLDSTSRCDPSNSKYASACVNNKPAKCELDGTYSITDCDEGESCFAVPKTDGQPGLDIGCHKPQNADNTVVADAKSSTKPSVSFMPAKSVQDSTQTSAEPKASSSSESIGHRPSRLFTSAHIAPSSADGAAQASFAPSNQIENSGIGAQSNPASGGFPKPQATTGEEDEVPAAPASASQAAQTFSVQSKAATGSTAGHKQENSEEDAKDSTSSRDKKGHVDKGIRLSFPGEGESSGSTSDQEDRRESSGLKDNSAPEANQKNVVAGRHSAADAAPTSSSFGLKVGVVNNSPTSTRPGSGVSTGEVKGPDVTAAPALPNDDFKGYITVTVTVTTTVHDR